MTAKSKIRSVGSFLRYGTLDVDNYAHDLRLSENTFSLKADFA